MFQNHGKGTTNSLRNGDKQIFRTTYVDGVERVEEYNVKSGKLLVRRWKAKDKLGRNINWEYEIGTQPATASSDGGSTLLRRSSENPFFECHDDEKAWIFLVKNIPYPENMYSIHVNNTEDLLVLRTSNRKYFRKWPIPSLRRMKIPLEDNRIEFSHSKDILTIRYEKPSEIVKQEQKDKRERASQLQEHDEDGNVECKTQ